MSSNALACPWRSLEGLLAATKKWPISYQKVLEKTPQLVGVLEITLQLEGVLVEHPSRRRGLNSKCCWPLGISGAKKEEGEIDAVYSNNEN